MFSFLSAFCLKYSLVTEVKLHPGANTGRGLKVIKFYLYQMENDSTQILARDLSYTT